MNTKENKYNLIINALRNSKPVFNDADGVAEKVIREIRSEKPMKDLRDYIFEFLFGWVYVGWVRRSMVAAAILVIVFFGYQQTLILNRISGLPSQETINERPVMIKLDEHFSDGELIDRLSGKGLSKKEMILSKKEIDRMIRSVNKLQLKYNDLITLIENNPELKKYVESKMNEAEKTNSSN